MQIHIRHMQTTVSNLKMSQPKLQHLSTSLCIFPPLVFSLLSSLSPSPLSLSDKPSSLMYLSCSSASAAPLTHAARVEGVVALTVCWDSHADLLFSAWGAELGLFVISCRSSFYNFPSSPLWTSPFIRQDHMVQKKPVCVRYACTIACVVACMCVGLRVLFDNSERLLL